MDLHSRKHKRSSFIGVSFLFFYLFAVSCSTHAEVQDIRKDTVISVEKAQALAKKFLQQKKIDWGSPTKIILSNGSFTLTYFTPDKELILLGRRTLAIDAVTGEIKLPTRF